MILNLARRHTLAAGMILALGFSLALGGCGHNAQNSQNGTNQPTTSQPGNTTTTGVTTPGSTTTSTGNNVQDLQNLDNSLNAAFGDLNSDESAATTDYSQMDQGVQP